MNRWSPALSLAEGVQFCPLRGDPRQVQAVREHHPAWFSAIMGFFPALERAWPRCRGYHCPEPLPKTWGAVRAAQLPRGQESLALSIN